MHHGLLGISGQPQPTASLPWDVPGPNGSTLHYLICYVNLNLDYWWPDDMNPQNETTRPWLWGNGYAIQSVVLPDHTSFWGFVYDQSVTGSLCSSSQQGSPCGSGDLLEVLFPNGGSILYTYENVGGDNGTAETGQSRCTAAANGTAAPLGECHAVTTRTVNDGNGNSSTTSYSYTSVPNPLGTTYSPVVYTTKESKPSNAPTEPTNDVVHTFSALSSIGAVVTAQLFETETDYYQGTASVSGCTQGSNCLKKIVTVYNGNNQPPWDLPVVTQTGYTGGEGYTSRVVNAVPTQISTTAIAANTSTVVNRNYATLFTAVGIACGYSYPGNNYVCNSSTAQIPSATGHTTSPQYSIAVNFVSPTEEDTSGPNGWLQTTTTSYEWNSPTNSLYVSGNLVALPVTVTNTDSAGAVFSQTTYSYDPTGYGNNTSVSRWLDTAGQSITTTSTQYDANNMPYLITDANGNKTKTTYTTNSSAPQCPGLYPQTVISAYQTSIAETSSYAYDCYTGALTGVSDPNGAQTNYVYSTTIDPLGRLTQVLYGLGTTPQTQLTGVNLLSTATLNYSGLTSATVKQDQNSLSDGLIQSTTGYDGLGRVVTKTRPDQETVTTSYGPNGQIASVTNPENQTGASTDGITFHYYDPFDRMILKVKPDGDQSWCYDGVQDAVHPQPHCSSSPNNTNVGAVSWVDVTDESGNHHQEVSNGLGQLIAVIEPDKQNGGSLAAETDYSYDNNGNLTNVTQVGVTGETPRVRNFTYDSLSRLLTAANPETGTVSYSYDADGNVSTKTDARGVTTTYAYDALNRLLSKSYSSNDPSLAPSSCYHYDTATGFGIGRLGTQWTQKGACSPAPPPTGAPSQTVIAAYDYMGRVKSEQQCVFSYCSPNSQPTYTYDLAGELTSYGDGRGAMTFTNQYDTAARLQTLTDQNAFTLFSAQAYSATGGVASALYGGTTPAAAAFTQTRTYDSRLRITGETDGK